tara:strand:+ start:235 stop:666 length:432 start_codon:yes stop_codon:yes gene_type:complete
MVNSKKMLMVILSGLLFTGLAGCFTNITKPNSWVSNTRFDVSDLKVAGQTITGESSSQAILFGLVHWGDRGFEAALENAKQRAGIKVTEVYDVKTDRKYYNILGLYVKATTVVTASVAQDVDGAVEAAGAGPVGSLAKRNDGK